MNSYVTIFISSNIDLNLSSMPDSFKKVLTNSVLALQRSDKKGYFISKCESQKMLFHFLCVWGFSLS